MSDFPANWTQKSALATCYDDVIQIMKQVLMTNKEFRMDLQPASQTWDSSLKVWFIMNISEFKTVLIKEINFETESFMKYYVEYACCTIFVVHQAPGLPTAGHWTENTNSHFTVVATWAVGAAAAGTGISTHSPEILICQSVNLHAVPQLNRENVTEEGTSKGPVIKYWMWSLCWQIRISFCDCGKDYMHAIAH